MGRQAPSRISVAETFFSLFFPLIQICLNTVSFLWISRIIEELIVEWEIHQIPLLGTISEVGNSADIYLYTFGNRNAGCGQAGASSYSAVLNLS